MGYRKKTIGDKCTIWLKEMGAKGFYDANYKNWHGKATDVDEYSSDIVAQFVIDNIREFKNIEELSRRNTYDAEHKGIHDKKGIRIEEELAIDLFNYCNGNDFSYEYIGKIIDYQTPLQDGHVPAIDLLSLKDTIIYILELKQKRNKENLLRCFLEAYTYWKQVNHSKLIDSFERWHNGMVTKVCAAPLIHKESYQYKELSELVHEGNRPHLLELAKMLKMNAVFVYCEDESNQKYKIEKETLY